MALRVSIGAGRWRLVQLVLVESALLAILAAAVAARCSPGGPRRLWSASINPPDNPARLALPADWRVLGFGLALTIGVTLLFGLAPALRASAVKPASALKGGEDPHSRRRLMHALIAGAGRVLFRRAVRRRAVHGHFRPFVASPDGFLRGSASHVSRRSLHRPQAAVYWEQVAEHLRAMPGVEKVALSDGLCSAGKARTGSSPSTARSPLRILGLFSEYLGRLDGHHEDSLGRRQRFSIDRHHPGVAMVNETFAKQYFGNENPIGKSFAQVDGAGGRYPFLIVGLVGDARISQHARANAAGGLCSVSIGWR